MKNKSDLQLVTSRCSGYKTSLEKSPGDVLPDQVW